ncbi:hypothetical protein [Actinomadura logoneensis]|nr:hypothetical protein [Actinomadura logoneensis]
MTRPNEYSGPGCLIWPLMVIVLPFRLAWELLVLLGRGIGWLFVQFARYVLRPIGVALYYLLVKPLVWVWSALLLPPLRLLGAFLAWIGRGLWAGLSWIGRHILLPIAKGIAWVMNILVVVPLTLLWRYVLAPIGRGLAWIWKNALFPVLSAAWRAAGRVLYYTLVVPVKYLVVLPVRWVWANIARPIGRALRAVWDATFGPVFRWLNEVFSTPAR